MQDNHNKPVFLDESQHRSRTVAVLLATISIVSLVAAVLFVISILRLPVLPIVELPSQFHPNRTPAAHGVGVGRIDEIVAQQAKPLSPANKRVPDEMRFLVARNQPIRDARQRLTESIRREQQRRDIPAGAIAPGRVTAPVRAAFYDNSDKESIDSLQEHIGQTTHLMPVWLGLQPDGATVHDEQQLAQSTDSQDPNGPTYDDIALRVARQNGVAILPVFQNCLNGDFQEASLRSLVNNPAHRKAVIAQLLQFVVKGGYQGINIDLETDQAADRAGMTAFMRETAAAFHPKLLVTQDIQLDSQAYDLPTLAGIEDFLVPMIYDQNGAGNHAGPIASQSWYQHNLNVFLQQVPANRTVIGVGNYGYDWKQGGTSPDTVSFEEAAQIAQESQDGSDGIIRIDPASLNPFFTYSDSAPGAPEVDHKVWLMDATTTYNEMMAAQKSHTLGFALWRLGQEDPSLWNFYGKASAAGLPSFSIKNLSLVQYNTFGTDFQGEGDVLDVVHGPAPGHRTITTAHGEREITGEQFQSYPSRWLIRRTGLVDQSSGLNTSKKIALTFDDGPDPRWTPQILSILDREHVKATFFVVGENAEAHPGLISREWDDGMEIGNHSYTHPDINNISKERMRLELDATQRVIEAITGHSTILFRAPNRADSEPSTWDDFQPVLDADQLGYIFIGEQNDPTDWLPGTTADRIIRHVVAHAAEGNCVLLHDAGGQTRAETIKALPILIEQLKAQGYTFVTVSELMRRPRSDVFPQVPTTQLLAVRLDRMVFSFMYWSGQIFTALFLLAVGLGVARVLIMGVLAIKQARLENTREFDPTYKPTVSVVIAAYNEAKVINKTIATLLSCDYTDIEIIVVDDGSKDGTAEVVRSAYGDEKRVTVLTKPNGGKASALNIGIKACLGEILVALDADTVFAPDTISKLVRHFADPKVGAVSGNVKVGNRRNVLTAWQAVEYITSQNFDRRAFDLLNCITVVPGAIGAWRKDAVILAGLYSPSTLAEDTDLTFKVQRLGYRIITDSHAYAFTEAPESLRDLAKQRYRWAFGTLQCLWKHKDAMLRPKWGTFGMVAMPSLWIYQIGFQAIAPIVDLTILWSLLYTRFITPSADNRTLILLGSYWLAFSLVELAGASLAFYLDGEDPRLLAWLPLQRFGYRQIMYYVIVKSLASAVRGTVVGWGKLERKGTTTVPQSMAASSAQPPGDGSNLLTKRD